jgi:hypothetical protein
MTQHILTPGPYRVLTVRQPWAWAIIHGPKRVENRSRRTKYRGPLLIHAAAKFERTLRHPDALAAFEREHNMKLPPVEELVLGAILGVVNVDDCIAFDKEEHAGDPWALGPWLWQLADPRSLAEPIPASGQLNLWTWDHPET